MGYIPKRKPTAFGVKDVGLIAWIFDPAVRWWVCLFSRLGGNLTGNDCCVASNGYVSCGVVNGLNGYCIGDNLFCHHDRIGINSLLSILVAAAAYHSYAEENSE